MNTDRFKFRVWDSEIKRYLKYHEGHEDYYYITGGNGHLHCDCFGTPIIEQCIGLKDKFGKLIYWGDVIENTFSDGTKTQWFIVWNEEEMKHVKLNIPWFKKEKLELGKNFSMAKHIVSYSCGIKKETAFRYEIIGNIHEPKFGIEIQDGDSK